MEEEKQEAVEEEAEGFMAKEAPGEEERVSEELKELSDKYVRLYAEFDNYKKKVAKDKEELARYCNESLLYELLPSIDHLEIALRHAGDMTPGGQGGSQGKGQGKDQGLMEGVENTMREFQRTLEKFGLKPIEALDRTFDPGFHHAITQVARDDVDEGIVVEELRKGYMCGDKVLRASLVAVSRKPAEEKPEDKELKEVEINNRGAKED